MSRDPEKYVRRAPETEEALQRALHDPARLAAVERSALLDTPAEQSFDALTRLAARLLGVPVSFVSIVDSNRDFYKSHAGFGEPLATVRDLGGRSFCHHTLDRDDMLVIDDTHSNAAWKSVPTVESLGVRAYAGVPLKLDGQNVGSFCVIDIQPRKWSDDELDTLQQLALSAGREMTLRASLLQARGESEQARSLARAREEVVAVVAHDLRTPLQILHLSTAMLQRDAREGQQALVGRMATAIDAMRKMADTLISSDAMLAAPALHKVSVSAAMLVRDGVEMMAPIADRAGISVALGPVADSTVVIDYAQMLRVLGNLIGNAIKYSRPGGSVTVSAARSDDLLALAIADNGKGMTVDEQARAFERGWQGAEGMVRGDGAGLGLAIAKRLTEEHGGHMALHSMAGIGSTVTVYLPCS